MKLMARSIALSVAVSLLVSGPLATFARAQQPAQPPAEQAAQPPAEQAAQQPAQPPAEQSAQQPAQPPVEQPAQQPAPMPAEQPTPQPAQEPPAPQPAVQPTAQQPQSMPEVVKSEEVESIAPYVMGATIANVVFVPGKIVTCGLGLIVGGGLMILTLGSGYKGATAFAKEGCGGKWILTARDLMGTDWILGFGDRADRN
jgi:hypothetical protein